MLAGASYLGCSNRCDLIPHNHEPEQPAPLTGKYITPQGCLVSGTLNQARVTAVSVKTVCTAGVEEGFLRAGVWLLLGEVTDWQRGSTVELVESLASGI